MSIQMENSSYTSSNQTRDQDDGTASVLASIADTLKLYKYSSNDNFYSKTENKIDPKTYKRFVSKDKENNSNDDLKKGNTKAANTLYGRYKTEICRSFREEGECKYGEKCQFAHGINDLRIPNRHPKYKTELCKKFHETGFCKYGPRCTFIHVKVPKSDFFDVDDDMNDLFPREISSPSSFGSISPPPSNVNNLMNNSPFSFDFLRLRIDSQESTEESRTSSPSPTSSIFDSQMFGASPFYTFKQIMA